MHQFKRARAILSSFTLLHLAVFWFFTGGINGIIAYSFATYFILLISVYKYKYHHYIIITMALSFIALYSLEWFFPSIISKYKIPEIQYIVNIISALSAFISIGIIMYNIHKEYHYDQKLISLQNMYLKKQELSLENAKNSAIQANASKAEFLSTMSHEIRTPLNGVIGLTNLLLEENPRKNQLEKINLLKFSSENLLNIINDILDYSKIEAGKIVLENVEFKLKNLIKSISQSFKIKADEKGIYLRIKLDTNIPETIIGDPTRLSQILYNLVGNAIKFTNSGGVTLDITSTIIDDNRCNLHFEVIDTGIGISEQNKTVIFDKFSQASSNITREFGGTGLGLAITKKLLQMHNTDIQLDSTIGQGSTFSFDINYKIGQQFEIQRPVLSYKKPENELLEGVKLLLAEDNPLNVFLAKKFLCKWKVSVDVAENGEIAVEMARKNNYDLILMDLQMPILDGAEAAKEIRKFSDPKKANVPIIALTASAMLEEQNKIFEAGMNEYVPKPFNPGDLFGKIKKYTSDKNAA